MSKVAIAGLLLIIQLVTVTYAKNVVVVSLDEHHATTINLVRVLHHSVLEFQPHDDASSVDFLVLAPNDLPSAVVDVFHDDNIRVMTPNQIFVASSPLRYKPLGSLIKIGAWSLTDYDHVLLLDSDSLITSSRGLDVFEVCGSLKAELCAVVVNGIIDCGVMVIKPSRTRFESLASEAMKLSSPVDITSLLQNYMSTAQPRLQPTPLDASIWKLGCGLSDTSVEDVFVHTRCGVRPLDTIGMCQTGDSADCLDGRVVLFQRLLRQVDSCVSFASISTCTIQPGCGWCQSACTDHLSLCLALQGSTQQRLLLPPSLASFLSVSEHISKSSLVVVPQDVALAGAAPAAPARGPVDTAMSFSKASRLIKLKHEQEQLRLRQEQAAAAAAAKKTIKKHAGQGNVAAIVGGVEADKDAAVAVTQTQSQTQTQTSSQNAGLSQAQSAAQAAEESITVSPSLGPAITTMSVSTPATPSPAVAAASASPAAAAPAAPAAPADGSIVAVGAKTNNEQLQQLQQAEQQQLLPQTNAISTPRLKETERTQTHSQTHNKQLSEAQQSTMNSLSSEQKSALHELEVQTVRHLSELRREQHTLQKEMAEHHRQLVHAEKELRSHLNQLRDEQKRLETHIETQQSLLKQHQTTRIKTGIITTMQTDMKTHLENLKGKQEAEAGSGAEAEAATAAVATTHSVEAVQAQEATAVQNLTAIPGGAPPIQPFRSEFVFDCWDRLIDHVDQLFQTAPTPTDNIYLVECQKTCVYPTNRPLDVWGGLPNGGWYTLDSVFCAAAMHQTAHVGAGKYQVTVELNVLTNRIPTFQGDVNDVYGESRSWHGAYPVMFQLEDYVPPPPPLPPGGGLGGGGGEGELLLEAIDAKAKSFGVSLPSSFFDSLRFFGSE